jgi:lysophospholipase L1-like esterase
MKFPFRITCALIALMVGTLIVDPSAATAQAPPLPTSMAAIGDSFTLGYNSGASDCGSGACPQWSWSTGTSSTSHYVRLLALSPGITGHAINAAVPGAFMSGFVSQVATATSGGNHPNYVTVLLGAADTCLGSVPTDVSVFTAQFRAGMDALFQVSPNSRVLVASIFSLESIRSAVLGDNPGATFSLCNSTFFSASDAARAAIMSRLQQFNAVLSTECATYANCQYDGGALFAHQWTRAEVSTVDNLHPSVAGQNMISTTLWNAGFWPSSSPSRPSATISSPATGGTYALNQTVSTSFTCAEGTGGPGLTGCLDSNGSSGPGGTLDTTTAGSHTYTVTATSGDGQNGSASIAYLVGFGITTTLLPNGTVSMPYGPVALQAVGQEPGATLKWKKLSLPRGLKLSSAGVLTGSPNKKLAPNQNYTVSVQVTEKYKVGKVKYSQTASATLNLFISS